MAKFAAVAALLALSAGVLAHPDKPHEIRAHLETRSRVASYAKRAVEKCSASAEAAAVRERAVARRSNKLEALRQKRGIQAPTGDLERRADKAAFEKYNGISHDRTPGGFNRDTPAKDLFADNATSALMPETIIGPYYVEGELQRTDLTDGQAGVPTHLDFQFIDINTCKPMPNLLIDIWSANSTGVYSGVAAPLQGGVNTTHGRGVQTSDADGVVQFDSIFPGHYVGRTNHFHVMSTDGANVMPNGTFEGGNVRHIGQVYFDPSLISAVEALEPYKSNEQAVTSNTEDEFTADVASEDFDPFMNYAYLGENPQDGVLMWLTIGLDPVADYNKNRTPASHWYSDGGVDLTNGTPLP
ncbi:hypothetical protein CDD81_311 [Ophiocordyceps australis]|uniref:Intradiol ring-cleavage dioxygenases domain-containing protein n=1 Tax=Ophiocordyceps australis TaxID=1399860 RepID=A0A2C5Y278_9HYPO|nr:hypothetical protein CDD81_311 [Ophiocordyceps australis]